MRAFNADFEEHDEEWIDPSEAKTEVAAALKTLRFTGDPYVHVSVIMLALQGGIRYPATPWCLHFKCHPAGVTREQRARCIHPQHLTFGDPLDNAFHACEHAKGNVPTPSRPEGWGRTEDARAARARYLRQRRR